MIFDVILSLNPSENAVARSSVKSRKRYIYKENQVNQFPSFENVRRDGDTSETESG